MTAMRQRWRRAAALTATGAAALIGTGIAAVPASAHTPVWTVDCHTVSVDLKSYDDKAENTVTIKADGKDLLSAEKFGSEFSKKLDLPEHKKEVEVRLIVKAGDGDQFSRDETKTAPVCDTPSTPTPTPTKEKPKPAPSDEPSSSPPPANKPAGGGHSSDDLAETGSSSATPVIAGVAGAVVLAGAGLVVVTRKRRSAQN